MLAIASGAAGFIVGTVLIVEAHALDVHADITEEGGLIGDDECSSESSGASGSPCALNALQRRGLRLEGGTEASAEAIKVGDSGQVNLTNEAAGIWHYALSCWNACGQPGMCEAYCGPGNACCRYQTPGPSECMGVRLWPVLTFYTCVHSPSGYEHGGPSTTLPSTTDYNPLQQGPSTTLPSTDGSPVGPSTTMIYSDPKLFQPSNAPLYEFYMYRVQSDEDYDPEDQDLGNPGGALWYLHNEIVWHDHMKRSGTYFSTAKTRIERFHVKTKATQPIYDLGMNFGVVNTYDSGKCTGPYNCLNYKRYGFTVGCETWDKHSPSAFPHNQWVGKNLYPGATWYSLPGSCPSQSFGKKTGSCSTGEPGGACKAGDPTGTGDCTYTYEKVGEISINELEGITDPEAFVKSGGEEYVKWSDKGVHNSFWNNKMSVQANQERIYRFLALFQEKYPDQPELNEPDCDFNRYKFFVKTTTWHPPNRRRWHPGRRRWR